MKPISVLLVEDYQPIREEINQMLAQHPEVGTIFEADSGEKAIHQVETMRPDVVLLDISLPDMNGLEATRVIKRKSPTTSIIVLLESTDHEYSAAAIEAGADACLSKESLLRELIPTIAKTLAA